MNGGPTPLVSIPLRNGTTLQIAPDAVRNGDRTFALASIQDARQVSPEPETIALRVAGAGLVEFQPERAGDGAVALEALFQVRQDLRPAGFGTPPDMPAGAYPSPPGYPIYPAYPPYPGYPPAPPYPPYGMPPILPPYIPSPPPGYAEAQALMERRAQGQLTPFPRSFGETLAGIFQLYGSKFSTWLLLGLCVALVAGVVSGGISYLYLKITGLDNAFSATTISSTGSFTSPYNFETGDVLIRDLIILGILVLLSIVFSAWQTAALSIGARDAILGRPVAVGASLAGGLRRLLPTLITSLLVTVLILLSFLPIFLGFTAIIISSTNSSSDTSGTVALFALLTCVFTIACLILVLFLGVRLGLSVTAAATANIGPLQAISRSWRITRGHFWHIFGIVLIINLMVGVVSYIGGLSAGLSPIVGYFIITPIILVFTAPFSAIMSTTLLYDMRLRNEGYASLLQEQGTTTPQQPAAPGTVPPLG